MRKPVLRILCIGILLTWTGHLCGQSNGNRHTLRLKLDTADVLNDLFDGWVAITQGIIHDFHPMHAVGRRLDSVSVIRPCPKPDCPGKRQTGKTVRSPWIYTYRKSQIQKC